MVLCVLAMLIGVLGLLGLRGNVVVDRTQGEDVRTLSPDQTDEVVGFAASLKQLCGGGPM